MEMRGAGGWLFAGSGGLTGSLILDVVRQDMLNGVFERAEKSQNQSAFGFIIARYNEVSSLRLSCDIGVT